MPKLVVNTAQLQCSMGTSPCPLMVLRPLIKACNQPAANIQDFKPMVNVASFGMCNSTTNPQVIALTAAAQGVHTPAPCVPVITGPWSPGATKVKIESQPALTDSSTCRCAWNGTVKVNSAGQTKVDVR